MQQYEVEIEWRWKWYILQVEWWIARIEQIEWNIERMFFAKIKSIKKWFLKQKYIMSIQSHINK